MQFVKDWMAVLKQGGFLCGDAMTDSETYRKLRYRVSGRGYTIDENPFMNPLLVVTVLNEISQQRQLPPEARKTIVGEPFTKKKARPEVRAKMEEVEQEQARIERQVEKGLEEARLLSLPIELPKVVEIPPDIIEHAKENTLNITVTEGGEFVYSQQESAIIKDSEVRQIEHEAIISAKLVFLFVVVVIGGLGILAVIN